MGNLVTNLGRRYPMRAVRIRRWYFKVGFLIVGYLAGHLITLSSAISGQGRELEGIIASVWNALLVVAASRLFCGVGEDVESPRIWWRATSKPRAGWVVGSIFALSAFWYGVDVLTTIFGHPSQRDWTRFPQLAVIVSLSVILAVYFLRSSARLAFGRTT